MTTKLSHALLPTVLFGTLLVVFVLHIDYLEQYDLLQYWASAKLYASGKNPYDTASLFEIQKGVTGSHFELNEPVILYATPLILPLVYPLSYFDFQTTKVVWLVLSFTSLFWGSYYLIINHLRDAGRVFKVLLLLTALTFGPFYSILWWGQISWLFYAGWVFFLLFFDRQPFRAGLALSLTLIKPHLLYLVYFLLFLNIRKQQPVRTLIGLTTGAVCLFGLASLINPNIFTWYVDFSATPPIFWKTPNLGSWLQEWTNIHALSIRLLPSIAFAILTITLWYFQHKLTRLCGSSNQLTLAGIAAIPFVSAPYGWYYDCVLIFPALALILINLLHRRQIGAALLLAAGLIGLNVLLGIFAGNLYQQHLIIVPILHAMVPGVLWFLGQENRDIERSLH